MDAWTCVNISECRLAVLYFELVPFYVLFFYRSFSTLVNPHNVSLSPPRYVLFLRSDRGKRLQTDDGSE